MSLSKLLYGMINNKNKLLFCFLKFYVTSVFIRAMLTLKIKTIIYVEKEERKMIQKNGRKKIRGIYAQQHF